jgi:glycosyltransferase involved in cell wall biosynthesis
MNVLKKKSKKSKIQNSEIINVQSKIEDIEEDADLIKKKHKGNINENEDFLNSQILKKIITKVFYILFVILSINILYNNKSIEPIPKEILNLNNTSLKWWDKVQLFFDICSKGYLLYNKRFRRNKNPKFSIIMPVLNKRFYLLKLIRSIQNQKYENAEIIFVDDHSTDGSIELIEQFMRKDKRIVLIKHETNKGTLITRNDGALNAKGEYIFFVDPDDMILEDSLELLYNATLKYPDVDVIQFRAYKKRVSSNSIVPWARGYKEYDKIVTQPELCSIMFYENGYLNQINFFIWAKLIKRKVFVETIEKLGHYKNEYMTLYEDVAMLFALLQIAKNYVYVRIYGYLYYGNTFSVFENRYKYRKANRTIRDCFLLSDILFDFSKNTSFDKKMALFTLNRIYLLYYHVCTFVTDGFDYIFKVLDKFIKCKVLTYKNKILAFELKKLFEETQNNLKKK